MNKLVLWCAWLLSDALEILRLRLRLPTRAPLRSSTRGLVMPISEALLMLASRLGTVLLALSPPHQWDALRLNVRWTRHWRRVRALLTWVMLYKFLITLHYGIVWCMAVDAKFETVKSTRIAGIGLRLAERVKRRCLGPSIYRPLSWLRINFMPA